MDDAVGVYDLVKATHEYCGETDLKEVLEIASSDEEPPAPVPPPPPRWRLTTDEIKTACEAIGNDEEPADEIAEAIEGGDSDGDGGTRSQDLSMHIPMPTEPLGAKIAENAPDAVPHPQAQNVAVAKVRAEQAKKKAKAAPPVPKGTSAAAKAKAMPRSTQRTITGCCSPAFAMTT